MSNSSEVRATYMTSLPTSKTLPSSFDGLNARSDSKEQRDPPPKYEEVALPTLDEYRQRAKSLVEQHADVIPWFPYPDPGIVKEYLEAFARGKSLGTENQQYVCAALDEFRRVMGYVDLPVDQAGLEDAGGATGCASWSAELVRQHREIDADTEVIQAAADSLGKYISETHGEDFVASEPGEVDCLIKLRSLFAEARRGKHDFSDLLTERGLTKTCFGKSEVFLDEPLRPGGPSAAERPESSVFYDGSNGG
ncbi:hypothetical protein F5Y05DRAFT_407352 [Hypoxylon sp. FL0543]|nr:hypothetical protein F5Y05DRAFT_407352 [Hypoxylon sp. FL0543]